MSNKFDIDFDPSTLPHGLYQLYWKEGGSSLASVGSDAKGNRWFAATNWTSGNSFDWSGVSAVERVDVQINPTENIQISRMKETPNGEYTAYYISPNAAYNRQIINAAIERIQETNHA